MNNSNRLIRDVLLRYRVRLTCSKPLNATKTLRFSSKPRLSKTRMMRLNSFNHRSRSSQVERTSSRSHMITLCPRSRKLSLRTLSFRKRRMKKRRKKVPTTHRLRKHQRPSRTRSHKNRKTILLLSCRMSCVTSTSSCVRRTKLSKNLRRKHKPTTIRKLVLKEP